MKSPPNTTKKRPLRSTLSSKVRIFAILWFFLVAVTLVCLLFLFRNVMTYAGNDNPSADAAGPGRGMLRGSSKNVRSYVKEMLSKQQQQQQDSSSKAASSTQQQRQHDKQPPNGIPNQQQQQQHLGVIKMYPEEAVTVAYAVSVTGCGSDPLTEGAAVLKHSIHRASVHGTLGGRYDYKMYAIYHPSAVACAKTLEALGYELLQRDTFVKVEDIKGEFLRKNIEKNGCCGEKEFIKLEAYTLTQHPIVVHLDLDVLVLKPLDNIFDVMMMSSETNKNDPLDLTQIDVQWPVKEGQPQPTQVNAFFTRDYNMVNAKRKFKPVQGGFLVLRPSMDVYNEFKAIALEGDFRSKGGWGGVSGHFYGAMTFQGIMPYYYDILHPGEAIELNRCVVNQMCDNPRDQPTKNDIVSGQCRTGETDCEDCRSRPIEEVLTTHYTLCLKPWLCIPHGQDMIQHRLCRKLHHEWYRIRSEMEQSWGRSGRGDSTWQDDLFYGYCTKFGNEGYVPIAKPYGSA